MPLHGKIVVIKRSGGDGTEFPLTTSCLFGRKAECDIRIQLPNVSKEHCRIDLNENKEVILTNLSSVNLTRVNGMALQQSERLKHGDLITILDRSFRFEYPPAPTPRKRTSGAKAESLKVLRDQQVSDTVVAENGEKRTSEVSKDPHLKDGANIDNIQRSLEKTSEVESEEDGSQLQNKSNSPFGDLYEIIKKSLDVKTPRKSSVSQVQTPSSRFCSPKPRKPAFFTPKTDGAELLPDPKGKSSETPQSVRKQGKISQVPPADELRVEGGGSAIKSVQRRSSVTPQKFTVTEVLEQIAPQTFKSPTRRRSKEPTPVKSVASTEQEERANKSPKTENLRRTSPRNSGAAEKVGEVSQKRKSGELRSNSPAPMMKRKRVSFGGHLSPELFDKCLPPDSPLRKGATPRRSLSLCKPKQSLLRRASVIGLLKKKSPAKTKTPSPKKPTNASPKTPPGRKSPKSGSPSPKRTSSAKKSQQSESSPKSTSPGKKSPKPASPVQKSPKSKSSPLKAASPVQKSPRSRSTSPKAALPAKMSPKSKSSPVKSPSATPKMREQCKSTTPGQQRSSLGKSTPSSVKNASLSDITPAKTPSDSGVQTPTVQGRFSVSRISTPSPTAEVATEHEASITATPKIQLRRKSMKSASRKTQSISRSAVKILQRRSGVSRASMKVLNSWADIVKFGQTKTQVVAPAKQKVTQKATKRGMPKPQTPARKLKDHVSTGHADSPVTIVVGRAHKRTVSHLTGAAPRVVTNTALFKKDMKMDEDLTGISDMFKTPANERKRRSLMIESSATKTPAAAVVEPSVLNTPEEPGEMMVSPLSAASTVKSQRYNSEAVQRLLDADQESSFVSDAPASEVQSESNELQGAAPKMTSATTPKQKPELPECLTGVKRIMKTPKQVTVPVEDIRGKLLITPKQKPEQQECLTGVKRIMKTPKQKPEPVEDIRGKLLITPKQKSEQQECLTGVKRIFKTPKQKAEPLEDLRGKLLKTPKASAKESGEVSLDGVKELLETPKPEQQADHQSERRGVKTPDIKSSLAVCLTDVKKVMKTPKEEYSPVEDKDGVKKLMRTPEEKEEPIKETVGIKRSVKSQRLRGVPPVEDFDGLQELMQEPPTYLSENKANEEVTVPQEASDFPQQQHQADTEDKNPVEVKTLALEPSVEKKPVRGRRAKTVKSTEAEGKQEAPEPSETPIITPVRGRRGKKPEAVAPPAARHTTRGRPTEMTENKENAPQHSKVVPKLKRGRKVPEDPSEMVQDVIITDEEVTLDPEREQRPAADVEHKVNESAAPVEKTEQRPKRVRKAKQPAAQQQNQPCLQTGDVPQAEEPEDVSKTCSEQPEVLPDVMETVVQAPETENLPDVEAAACEVTETIKTSVQKKPVRGRRAKLTESKEAESEREAAESPDRPVSAPVRGKRAKKTEAAAPPAVKQTTRNRNAKSEESTTDQPAVETQVITEVSAEAVCAQTSLNATQEKIDSALPTEAVTSKPVRGRKAKLTPVEPEKTEVLSSKIVPIAEPPLPVPSAAGRPVRGRKAKPEVEQSKVAENTDTPDEVKPHPPARAKRGRNAQQKEDVDVKTATHEILSNQEPVKNSRRARKAEQDNVEPTEVQAITTGVPEKTEAQPTEPERSKQAAVAAKPRRGGRKAKPNTAIPVESTEVLDSSTDKPKGGRRGKQVTQDVVTVETSKRELEEQSTVVSSPQNIKAVRGKGRKNEVPQVITAKRARRGAATEEPAVQASEPAPAPIEPAKKGRRATAKATGAKEVQVSSDPAKSTEDLSEDVMDNPKTKKSVKFHSDLQILEIPKATPVKVVRGKRSKPADIKNENASKKTNKPEEKGLSEKVVEAQPVKRGRRGVKAAAADATAKSTSSEEAAEAEPQPKTRRGRSAKK